MTRPIMQDSQALQRFLDSVQKPLGGLDQAYDEVTAYAGPNVEKTLEKFCRARVKLSAALMAIAADLHCACALCGSIRTRKHQHKDGHPVWMCCECGHVQQRRDDAAF